MSTLSDAVPWAWLSIIAAAAIGAWVGLGAFRDRRGQRGEVAADPERERGES